LVPYFFVEYLSDKQLEEAFDYCLKNKVGNPLDVSNEFYEEYESRFYKLHGKGSKDRFEKKIKQRISKLDKPTEFAKGIFSY